MGFVVTPALMRRLRVLRLRQRVEVCSRTLYARTFGLEPTALWHRRVRTRLRLLPAFAGSDEEFIHFRAVAAQLAWVYEQCCDVLHGRRAFTDLPEPVVSAWTAVVEDGERLIRTALHPPG
jgi:hypothetical protein